MKRANEKGTALILTVILLLVLSVIAVSLMFVSQTETWSSMNYRLMSQARYGAESGLNEAANYLMYTYTAPGTGTDPLSNYVLTTSPVTYSGSPVVLSSNSAVSSNYPVSSVQTSFSSAASGSVTNGNTPVNYTASATLLSMQQITPYGTTTPVTAQTWQITADGTIGGVRNATVEVSAILERQVTPTFNYAVFATNNGCSALTFGGGGTTNSYDSTTVSGGKVTTQAIEGNVGTNGNLTTGGSTTTINGNLYTPRAGVGACTSSNVTAWTDKSGTVTGSLVELPQPITYPNPTIPPPGSTDLKMDGGFKCPSGANAIPGCSVSGSNVTIPPGSYGNVSLTAGTNLHLSAGTYNINSISEAGTSQVIIDSGPVILNVAGNSLSGGAAAIDLTGGGISNPSLVPSNFQIFYAGTANVKLKGGAAASALVDAPNASFSFSGGGDWYGAVIGQYMTDMGGAAIHYDRRLKEKFYYVGNPTLESFTWNKY